MKLAGLWFRVAGAAVKRAPFADEILGQLAEAERLAVRAIRQHLINLDPPPLPVVETQEAADDHRPETPTELLRALLDRSMYTSPDDSRTTLYLDLLEDLVPDEARILAALSDGSAYPVIHIAEPGAGGGSTMVLTNASTVGRASGVSLPQHTPLYLTRMLQSGLVTIGPEGTSMYDEYEILLTDSAVNLALARARRGMRSARVIRRTVRISELGQDLWEAAK
ncbi:Abi-alpha family protein [Mycobacterium sp. 48b]|uniref:Abi-alpha family protein n=1 Tax=Mycobacterium sp. 48b TaxID=3400426 RepID=UPI003AACA0DC